MLGIILIASHTIAMKKALDNEINYAIYNAPVGCQPT
jgi:hypothetical protein